jgi:predicted DsbA family dithiol-disulfide isomerase
MERYLVDFARQFGVPITFASHIPNTRPALALAEFARSKGRLDEFKTSAMRAYWKNGEDIENTAVLRRLARDAGLDPDQAQAALENPHFTALIDAVRTEAEQLGVTGIPTMIIGPIRVVGCQPYERIVEACVRAGAQKIVT